MKVYNPYNQEVIGEITFSNQEEALEILDKSYVSKSKMRLLSSAERSAILKGIVAGIEDNFDRFVEAIVKESGKPYRYAKGEVLRAIQTFTIASEECKRLPHELFDIDSSPNGKNLRGEYVYFPKGVVLAISPFNFPLNLVAHKVAPAIATGCPVILKPSSKTPLTAELLSEIIQDTSIPKAGFSLLHCENEVTRHLIEHSKVSVISFTGSDKVGWDIKTWANKKSVVLELGGNAAAIVANDADVDLAVKELMIGGFAYSGQVCIHTQRIYVHESVREKFIQKYIEKTKALNIGNPMDEETEFGVLIDEENAVRIESWVNEAIENGAHCLIGGRREGSLYLPTVLTNVAKGLKVRDKEVFGPVVLIESYKDIEVALAEVNDSIYGLQAAIFTDSIATRDLAFDRLEVGTLIHNKSTTFRVDDMPYGGIKDSGFGREGVRYSMLDFLEAKLLIRK